MDTDSQQAVQTKGALKGWSTLMPEKAGPTPHSAGPKKVSTSDTFDAFRKAAKEKEARERGLKEQQELARQHKERPGNIRNEVNESEDDRNKKGEKRRRRRRLWNRLGVLYQDLFVSLPFLHQFQAHPDK